MYRVPSGWLAGSAACYRIDEGDAIDPAYELIADHPTGNGCRNRGEPIWDCSLRCHYSVLDKNAPRRVEPLVRAP